MKFIDTHAHLAMLEHSPLEEVLQRAKETGIETLVSVSVDEKSWESNQSLALRFPHIYFTLGLHPHEAKHWSDIGHKIEKRYLALTDKKKCVAIGEIGLDYYYNHSDKDAQLKAFEEQLILAKKINLPIVIHCRDAFSETYSLIKKIGITKGGVMHCFTGNKTQAFEAIDLGLKISFSGILTFKNAIPIQEAAKAIPLKEIVIETDCPFLAPIPMRGKPNEPSYLSHTAASLAHLRSISIEEIAKATTQNAKDLFQF